MSNQSSDLYEIRVDVLSAYLKGFAEDRAMVEELILIMLLFNRQRSIREYVVNELPDIDESVKQAIKSGKINLGPSPFIKEEVLEEYEQEVKEEWTQSESPSDPRVSDAYTTIESHLRSVQQKLDKLLRFYPVNLVPVYFYFPFPDNSDLYIDFEEEFCVPKTGTIETNGDQIELLSRFKKFFLFIASRVENLEAFLEYHFIYTFHGDWTSYKGFLLQIKKDFSERDYLEHWIEVESYQEVASESLCEKIESLKKELNLKKEEPSLSKGIIIKHQLFFDAHKESSGLLKDLTRLNNSLPVHLRLPKGKESFSKTRYLAFLIGLRNTGQLPSHLK